MSIQELVRDLFGPISRHNDARRKIYRLGDAAAVTAGVFEQLLPADDDIDRLVLEYAARRAEAWLVAQVDQRRSPTTGDLLDWMLNPDERDSHLGPT